MFPLPFPIPVCPKLVVHAVLLLHAITLQYLLEKLTLRSGTRISPSTCLGDLYARAGIGISIGFGPEIGRECNSAGLRKATAESMSKVNFCSEDILL